MNLVNKLNGENRRPPAGSGAAVGRIRGRTPQPCFLPTKSRWKMLNY